jgi:hypothetical protein
MEGEMSAPMAATAGHKWPPKLMIAGVVVGVDRLNGENGTIWLFNSAGDRIAEICDVSRILIGVEDPPDF